MRLAGNDPASSRFAQQALFGEGYLNFMLRLNFFQYLGLAGGGILNNPPVVNQFQGQVEPELRAKFWELGDFSAFRFMHVYPKKRPLEGPLIDELPLSEDRSLQTFPGSTWNYLDWLFAKLRRGFVERAVSKRAARRRVAADPFHPRHCFIILPASPFAGARWKALCACLSPTKSCAC